MPLTTVQSGMMDNIAQYTSFKNRIINGAMQIDQRSAGASVTISGSTYTLDRWYAAITVASKFSVQQNAGSITPPVGFSNYLGVTSLSAYSVTSTDIFSIAQYIEGFNIADLGWGTANAATVTLSFWVRSSLTGTFGGFLSNNGGARSYPFSYTISAANTWEQKSITIAGDTSGTWLTTNGIGIRLGFGLGVGATYSGTAGAWSGSQLWSSTGATSVVGTSGATFYVTGVQLEKGSTATSFDYRPYGTELQLCQRYYWLWAGTTVTRYGLGYNDTTSSCYYMGYLPCPMRATPTIGSSAMSSNGATLTPIAISSSANQFSVANSGAGLTVGATQIYVNASSGLIALSAEL